MVGVGSMLMCSTSVFVVVKLVMMVVSSISPLVCGSWLITAMG